MFVVTVFLLSWHKAIKFNPNRGMLMLSEDSKGEEEGCQFRANTVLLLLLKKDKQQQMKEGIPRTLKYAQRNCKIIINVLWKLVTLEWFIYTMVNASPHCISASLSKRLCVAGSKPLNCARPLSADGHDACSWQQENRKGFLFGF